MKHTYCCNPMITTFSLFGIIYTLFTFTFGLGLLLIFNSHLLNLTLSICMHIPLSFPQNHICGIILLGLSLQSWTVKAHKSGIWVGT
jgi:hypothetical protein